MSSGWESQGAVGAQFCTTHWSVVLAAGQPGSAEGAAALAKLCQAYWYPLYVYLRGRGKSPEEAKDLTQEFFSRLLARNGLAHLDPETGRFRSFLLASARNLLTEDWKRGQTVKRGGTWQVLSLDDASAEVSCQAALIDAVTPEKLFERGWAAAVVQRALARLLEEHRAAGREDLFEVLKEFLSEKKPAPYAAIAERFGISPNSVGVAIHRLRQRFREVLREEVALTVRDPAEVDDELRHLVATLTD